ncbi:MAG: tetratricopeptide repeat protein [Myxococcales bacterium]|nr:tetratricopeptide repeat protein [Myxococcales bacterium]
MPLPAPRSRRILDGLLALAVGLSLGGLSIEGHAAPGDDWSLERRKDDPALVSQRMAKLERNPFDQAQWRALTKAVGFRSLATRIRKARESRPSDVSLQILEARVLAAEGDPAAAAAALAKVEPRAGRLSSKVFEQRIEWLEAASDHRAAATALVARAEATKKGPARDQLLERAHAMAERGDLHEQALELARTLVSEHPDQAAAQLRLARAASRAGEGMLADEAYERAIAKSGAHDRDELSAERARARLATDNPSGAAQLLWSMLESPSHGSRGLRASWWDQLADAHQRAGTTELLVTRLTTWLADHGTEAAAWRTLAQAQETAGIDPSKAWAEALRLSPRDVESHTALVQSLESKGDTGDAIEQYEQLLSRHPGEVELGLDLASRLIAAGQRERGLELAAEIEARIARKPKSLLLLLDFYNLNDEGERALDVARRVVSLRPRSADARVALGEQLYQMNRVEEALEQWAAVPRLVRPTHRGWAKHAEILSEHGRTADAVGSLKVALKAQPEDPQYLRLAAVLAEEQRRPGLALGLWEKVRELSTAPEHRLLRDEARTRLVELLVGGTISKRRSKLDSAQHDAQALLDAGTPREDAIEAGRLLAELYTRQENYPAAVTIQQRLLDLDPDDPERLAALAAAQRRAGQVQSALGTLEELLTVEPTRRADTLAEMSELAFEAGDADRALDAASEAARKDRSRVDALIHLGELHERRGDTDEARRAYEEAIESDPRDARARLRLAELSLTLGDAERSAEAFREILDLGGPPELLRAAGKRALDLAEASDTTAELFDLAVRRTVSKPEADEPRQFLLEALDRVSPEEVERWLREGSREHERSAERIEHLRRPLVVALGRGSVSTRLLAAEHLGHLGLPDTAEPLARLGATLRAPRDSTATVRAAFERTRVTAIEAAGRLRDPAAIDHFRDILLDASQSQGTRHAAAWALAGVGGPEAATVLSRFVESGFDPMLASLGCLVMSRLSREEIDRDAAFAISATARDNSNPTVRHACAFAEAALTTDSRVDRLHAQLRVTDPVLASIAAWRLGRVRKAQGKEVEALLMRYLGPAGLPRDAAAAGLSVLLSEREVPLAPLPAPAASHAWATTIERWLKAQVAPRVDPLSAAAMEPWAEPLHAALEAAASGTRAERDAAASARCEATDGSPAACLSPLVDAPIRLPRRD